MIRRCPVTRMQSILMEERTALLTGNLAALDKIADHKDKALQRVLAADVTLAQMNDLAQLAARNALLLDAVSRAIRSVRDFALNGPAMPESVAYGADGLRHSLQQPVRHLTQKA